MNEINFEIQDIKKIDLSMDVGVKEISPPIENLEVTPSKEQQIFKHENSYGYDEVIVNPIPNEYIIPVLQDKEITPTKETQNVTYDNGYDGLNEIVINPIPDNYIEPSGMLDISENKTYDVTEYSKVNVDVIVNPNLQDKSITITENGTQNITFDEGYDGLNNVEVIIDVKGGSEPSEDIEIPDGYILLDRLISHGEEYIDTGLIPSANLGFEIDFRTSDLFEASGKARTIFGCRNRAYYKNAYQFTTYTTSGDGDVGGVFAFGSVSSSSKYKNMKYSCHMNNIKRMKISFRNFVFTDAEGTETLVTENMEFTDPINIPLFALNDNGGFRENANMTLYRCKFYDGDTLIRDFVPVLNGSEPGLLDLVNNVFYQNQGSGDFTY